MIFNFLKYNILFYKKSLYFRPIDISGKTKADGSHGRQTVGLGSVGLGLGSVGSG
jgi:hypothetical protein